MSHLRKSDQTTMEHFAGLDAALGTEGESGVCAECGQGIINTGTGFWDHAGNNKPQHKAVQLTSEQAKRLLAEIYAPDSEIEPLSDEEVAEIEAAYLGHEMTPEYKARLRAQFEEMWQEWFQNNEADSRIVLPYHDAPEDEPLSTWLPASIHLDANTSPRQAADILREMYTAEWIADLLVCLLSRTAHTEASHAT